MKQPVFLLALAGMIGLACLTPAGAAPDEAAYGAAQGYAPGDRSNWYQQQHIVGAYTAMETLFPTRAVRAGGDVRPLPRHPASPALPFVQAYLASHPVTGLLVLKDGRVLAEHYQYGRDAQQRFTSFSMAKTVVGMAVGVAIAEGRIASIDDPVQRYEPALADSAWQGVTLRQVLTMSSGVRFDETYDKPNTDIARFSRAWTQQRGTLLNELTGFKARDTTPGEHFHYVSAETQVLAQVLVRATGQPLADYVGEKIWGPMGAEADAAWVLDASGQEAGHCCLSARLRDWARFGQLLLDGGQREDGQRDGGQRDGRSIIPAAWVQAATHVRPQDTHLQPRRATPYLGYGYQIWILPDELGFALLGVHGQAVYVDPSTRLVMVQTAVWPKSSDTTLGRERDRFWRQLVMAAARM